MVVLQVRERAWTEKDGDLKTLKKLLHESFQAEPASKVCNMSDSKVIQRMLRFVAILTYTWLFGSFEYL